MKKFLKILFKLVLILGIAAGAAYGGYYGYQQYQKREQAKATFTSRPDVEKAKDGTSISPGHHNLAYFKKQLSEKYPDVYNAAYETPRASKIGSSVVIPGQIVTPSYDFNKKKITDADSMTPQGLTVAGKYLLISAYDSTHNHRSVIYCLDKKTGKYGQAKEIELNGKNTNAGNFSDLFSYASQAPVIFADSLLFNLTLGESISREKVEKICDKLDLRNLIKEKGLDYQLGEEADKLSGGQLARIELARAILMARPVLLLDEINASLDKRTSEFIHQYLLNSNLTFIEVIHHYEKDDLNRYDKILDLEDYI